MPRHCFLVLLCRLFLQPRQAILSSGEFMGSDFLEGRWFPRKVKVNFVLHFLQPIMAAASGSSLQGLSEEALCSICLDYFKDPVIIECGHNFCRPCLTHYWEGKESEEASCPQCRAKVRRNVLIPNRQLANLAEKLGHLEREKAAETKRLCEKHQDPLKLFCQDDKTLICVICDKSKQHQGHKVVPVEEAAQEYKELITTHLQILMKERAKIVTHQGETEKEREHLLKQTKAEMEKMKAEFRRLYQFLEEQEKVLQAQMEEVEKEIARKGDEHLARLSEELSSLGGLIQEMVEKCLQPPGELLQVVGRFLKRDEEKQTFENPVVFPPELKWKIWDFCDINPFLESVMKQFKDALLPGLQLQKANVILDPDTAHLKLIVSEDHKSVTSGDNKQDLADNPKRFAKSYVVLGQERFTAGRHFWEVVVGSEEGWLAGVARESVERKDYVVWNPEGGALAVGKWAGAYGATSHPRTTFVPPSDGLKRIRVSLNCAAGRVAFYDADTAAHLYIFSEASFTGMTVLPIFNVYGKGHIRISS